MIRSNLASDSGEHIPPHDEEAGVVLVEFIYVIPVLLFLIIAGFEFGNLLHLKQSSAFIAKESALYAYKECSPYHDAAPRDACLEYVAIRMQALAAGIIENADIDMILSVYRDSATYRPPDNDPIEPLSRYPAVGQTTNLGTDSKVGPIFANDTALAEMLETRELIAIAEVDIQYRPVFVRILGVIDFARFDFYEISIY